MSDLITKRQLNDIVAKHCKNLKSDATPQQIIDAMTEVLYEAINSTQSGIISTVLDELRRESRR